MAQEYSQKNVIVKRSVRNDKRKYAVGIGNRGTESSREGKHQNSLQHFNKILTGNLTTKSNNSEGQEREDINNEGGRAPQQIGEEHFPASD